jgi:hypothetical protein
MSAWYGGRMLALDGAMIGALLGLDALGVGAYGLLLIVPWLASAACFHAVMRQRLVWKLVCSIGSGMVRSVVAFVVLWVFAWSAPSHWNQDGVQMTVPEAVLWPAILGVVEAVVLGWRTAPRWT